MYTASGRTMGIAMAHAGKSMDLALDVAAESGGEGRLDGAAESGGEVRLDGAAESGGEVRLDGAAESGGEVRLDGAGMSRMAICQNVTPKGGLAKKVCAASFQASGPMSNRQIVWFLAFSRCGLFVPAFVVRISQEI